MAKTSCVLLALAALVACDTKPPAPGTQAESSGGEEPSGSSSAAGTTMAPEPDPDSGSDSDSDSDGSDEPPSGFIDNPDGGGGGAYYECDPYTQDCPAGQKCMFWANDGGSAWNATRCSNIYPDADDVGEPCTVEGSGVSGIDSCVLGAMCWDVDPETNEGECVEMCSGSHADPFCSDPSTICEGRGPYLCLSSCCPIEQDCPEGQACYPIQDTFSCAPDASGEMGVFGDPCEYINVCDPGLVCLGAAALPPGLPCEGAAGCCTSLCQTHQIYCSTLDPALECTAWYDEGYAPPGLEHVGVCVLP